METQYDKLMRPRAIASPRAWRAPRFQPATLPLDDRASLNESLSDKSTERTYTTKHGILRASLETVSSERPPAGRAGAGRVAMA